MLFPGLSASLGPNLIALGAPFRGIPPTGNEAGRTPSVLSLSDSQSRNTKSEVESTQEIQKNRPHAKESKIVPPEQPDNLREMLRLMGLRPDEKQTVPSSTPNLAYLSALASLGGKDSPNSLPFSGAATTEGHPWTNLAGLMGGPQASQQTVPSAASPSPPLGPLTKGLLETRLNPPEWPSKWSMGTEQRMRDRLENRISVQDDRVGAVVHGRMVPTLDDVVIGSGSHFRLAILFLDICDFSGLPNWTWEEQKQVLEIMNLFMAEMIALVREHDGHFEKNTGDGLMAYFGAGAKADPDRVKAAVEAATKMHYFNDQILGPHLDSRGLPRLRFRVGIDVGPVTIGRVGVKSSDREYNSLVAIGTTANIACKIMKLIPSGGICIGQYAYENLPQNWYVRCKACVEPTTFAYVKSQQPYPAWELTHRLSQPPF
jgi:adenylate cyclase